VVERRVAVNEDVSCKNWLGPSLIEYLWVYYGADTREGGQNGWTRVSSKGEETYTADRHVF